MNCCLFASAYVFFVFKNVGFEAYFEIKICCLLAQLNPTI